MQSIRTEIFGEANKTQRVAELILLHHWLAGRAARSVGFKAARGRGAGGIKRNFQAGTMFAIGNCWWTHVRPS